MASFFDNKARAAQVKQAQSGPSRSKAANGVSNADQHRPWVERYRPRTLDDVKSQDHATMVLKRMVNASNLPHLLCYGPPGNGKTSTILALCRDLFGPELFHARVLELNASDERGIAIIRTKVRSFAAQALVNTGIDAEYRRRYPCPPFKVIILDEADNLNHDAQSALRRVMEIHSKTCRFALICNYVTRIIDPIGSRTAKFRFKALTDDDAKGRVADILSRENVEYEDGVIEHTLKIADGDLRRALQLLQSATRLVGATSSSTGSKRNKKQVPDDDDDEDTEMTDGDSKAAATKGGKITKPIIDEIAGVLPESIVSRLLSMMRKGSANSNFNRLKAEVDEIVAEGYSANEVLLALYAKLMMDDMVESRRKNKMSLVFSEKDHVLGAGADEHLVLLNMVCELSGLLVN